MKLQRFLVVITIVNLMLFVFLLLQIRKAETRMRGSVLRGSALEIVDDHQRVRASLKIQREAQKHKMPNGEFYTETVILRLIDAQGRPYVKLAGSEEGAGLAVIGLTDQTHAILKAEGKSTFLKLSNNDGHQQFMKP